MSKKRYPANLPFDRFDRLEAIPGTANVWACHKVKIPDGPEVEYRCLLYGEYLEFFNGSLPAQVEAHALFSYALKASLAYDWEENGVRYEDEPEPVPANYRRILEQTAVLYKSDPDSMVKFWPQVEEQFARLNLLCVPNEEKYRFNAPNIIHIN